MAAIHPGSGLCVVPRHSFPFAHRHLIHTSTGAADVQELQAKTDPRPDRTFADHPYLTPRRHSREHKTKASIHRRLIRHRGTRVSDLVTSQDGVRAHGTLRPPRHEEG